MPTPPRKLTPAEQMRILEIVRESFYRQLKKIRAEQYQIVAGMIQRIDREKTDQLLQSLKESV